MENFKEIEDVFDESRAWARVASSEDLAACWSQWIDQPETARDVGQRGLALIERHQGAVDRTVTLLEPWLARLRGTA